MEKGKIYGLICPIDNKIKYVGQTIRDLNKRKNGHLAEATRGAKLNRSFNRKNNWILDLRQKGLECSIVLLEECEIKNLDKREIFWIKELRKTENLLNFSDGWSYDLEKFCVKISESKKGNKNPNFEKKI